MGPLALDLGHRIPSLQLQHGPTASRKGGIVGDAGVLHFPICRAMRSRAFGLSNFQLPDFRFIRLGIQTR